MHGNNKKKEVCPDGSPDENVFDIQQGVSINMFIKTGEKKAKELGKVYYYDLYGKREEKYDFLTNTPFSEVKYKELNPIAPMYFFVPKDFELMEEHEKGVSLDSIFCQTNVSVVTAKDKILVDFNPKDLLHKVSTYYDGVASKDFIQEYAYRPFDKRFVYYDTKLIERPREILMKNFIGHDNIALLTCRQIAGNEWSHVSIDNHIIDDCRVSNKTKERGYVFPLYLYTNEFGKETKVANLNDEEWQKFNNAIGRGTTPEELLAYIYAVLHSPSYRERYKEFLKVDFPRIPLPTSESEFVRLAQIGQQLIDLHMMRNTQNWKCDTTFPEPGSQQIDMLKWKDKQVWINKQQYFGNVPEEVWNFYIGGYQPAQKWLKDRKGRTLVFDDIKHYLYIIHALAGTIKLMQKI